MTMTYRIGEMRCKEVIDIGSGARYGYVDDLEFDAESGSVTGLVIRGRLRLFGLLGRESDLIFPWGSIKRMGEDIVLVDSNGRFSHSPRQISQSSRV